MNEGYDDAPVVYCAHCLSLRIRSDQGIDDYCDVCGSTDMEMAGIDEWEELYERRYGKKFVNHKTK